MYTCGHMRGFMLNVYLVKRLSCFLALLVVLGAIAPHGDMVLCLGAEGHMALELPHAGHYAQATHAERAGQDALAVVRSCSDSPSNHCVDIPFPSVGMSGLFLTKKPETKRSADILSVACATHCAVINASPAAPHPSPPRPDTGPALVGDAVLLI